MVDVFITLVSYLHVKLHCSLNSSECRMILYHVVHQNHSLAHHGSSKPDFNIDALM